MTTGSCTALVTPFNDDAVDYKGFARLVAFQVENGIDGVLAAGTTGESPSLTWNEHNAIIENTKNNINNINNIKDKCICIAGTGSNNTSETLAATKHAVDVGVDAVLLVDPYYNGPSSLEIRKEYIEPVAKAFPGIDIIPYLIPGRTGTQLLPEDLAILNEKFDNINTVKDATGNIENMKLVRKYCRPGFTILSGDDDLTCEMMSDPQIKASGVISVVSNIAPLAVSEMVRFLNQGNLQKAQKLMSALKPLFKIVTVKTFETTPYGEVVCRARNPLPVKTLMSILGMPSGGCRQPLGKMTKKGLKTVLEAARSVNADAPEIFRPLADFFDVDIDERLNDPLNLEGLYYGEY